MNYIFINESTFRNTKNMPIDKDIAGFIADWKQIEINGTIFDFMQLKNANKFVIEKEGEGEIGSASLNCYDPNHNGCYLDNIRINPNYRRIGLATHLYQYIENQIGQKLHPSPIKRSKEIKNYWKKKNVNLESTFLDSSLSLILYHGTNNEFDAFSLEYFNSGSSDGGWLGYGVYLTNDYQYAQSYGEVLKCRVIIDNPYVLKDYSYSTNPEKLSNQLGTNSARQTTSKLKEMGYDSVILTYNDPTFDNDNDFIEACIFNPNNIKIL